MWVSFSLVQDTKDLLETCCGSPAYAAPGEGTTHYCKNTAHLATYLQDHTQRVTI